ncbi:MAG: hypothetical protein JOY90_08160 [Bradyrhizobium sp.]|uniref:hypothetical protein n=1 Tax=Bradyrhizobium sp. TaxID=376 RepID=UPI001DFFBAC2|nr:hypothetical protein [Bradyrhizobium sp.]MBV9560418.1 hypothetical protein [Bradyrhizobium sp.]
MKRRRRIDWLGVACTIIIVVGCAATLPLENYGLIRIFAVIFPVVFGAYAYWAWRESR